MHFIHDSQTVTHLYTLCLLRFTFYLRFFPVYGELVAALQRLQHKLKENNAPKLRNLESQLSTVQGVLLSPQFGRALSVCNKVREVTLSNEQQCLPSPQGCQAQELVRDVRSVNFFITIFSCDNPEPQSKLFGLMFYLLLVYSSS